MEINNTEQRENIDELVKKLEKYDIISFDIFDTLILRPFKDPQDLFRMLGIRHNILNFYEIRKKAQKTAREKAKKVYGHTEVTIYDIYKEINLITNLNIENGVKIEFEAEKNFCYANPYMKKVFDKLIAKGKEVIIISDMYIPHDMMKELLESCGYYGEKALFVSCDYSMTKLYGDLYKYVKENYVHDKSIIHVGDNQKADIKSANENNIESYYYKRNGEIENEISKIDMSKTIGSIYKGIVSNYLNNGCIQDKTTDIFYKYGFMYSGIFILGYVNWIHKYAKENNIDKLLFLARDGYILKMVYERLYNDIPSEYCLWSRNAALKTSPEKDLERYIWQFVTRVVDKGQKVTIKELLNKLNFNFLEKEFTIRNINLNDIMNMKYAKLLKEFILKNKEIVIAKSKENNEGARKYYEEKVGNSKRVGIVDIGYRGSGAIALKDLFSRWNFKCEVKSLLAIGTSRKDSFDDVADLSGNVNIYAISNYKNYDFSVTLQKYLLTNIAIIDILVASAPKPSFLYFDIDDNGKIFEFFDEEDTENYKMINSLHNGIIDFIREYVQHTNSYDFLQEIPARDAITPLISLMKEANYETLANNFKDFYYTYLLTDKKSRKIKSFYDIYLEEMKKNNPVVPNKKKIKKENKKFKNLNKIIKRIEKNLNSNENKIRYYYTKCYEKNTIDNNIILVQSYAGDNFSGNPYYMLKELYNKKEYGKFNFFVGIKSKNFKKAKKFLCAQGLKNVKLVKINSRKYARILSKAKYLINNVAFPNYFIKKEGQVYINTWHGTPLKGLGKSIKDAPNESGNYTRNFLMTDYFIMPNNYTYEIMKRDYMINNLYKGEYIISGYPRNSVFYDNKQRNKIRRKLKLEGKKVIVYMPTWRRAVNGKHEKQIETIESLLNSINEALSEDEILYVKLHNLVNDFIDLKKYDRVKMFPKEYETYEFLNIADCLITDYSSVMYDFANTDKKIILYAYDEEEYMNGRSVYSSIHEMPFNITRTEQEVINEIKDLSTNNSYREFKQKYCSGDSIDLCSRICEYIFLSRSTDLNIEREKIIKNSNILVYVGNLSDTYKRKMIFDELKYVDNKENIFINFYRKRSAKNKLFINEFSDDFKYINMQGEKDITLLEGLAYVLYYKFKLNGKWLEKKIDNAYKREVKRLFPNMNFSKVIDMIGNSVEILNLYSNIDCKCKEVYIINNNIYKLNKYKKYKKEITRRFNKFNKIYVEVGIKEYSKANSCDVKLIEQDRDKLFTNDIIVDKDVNDIFRTQHRRSYNEENIKIFQ